MENKEPLNNVESVARSLAYQIVHSESGHYQPVYESVLKSLTTLAEEIKATERQFILNVLDGIDIADKQMGVRGGTKAIRHALASRVIVTSPTL